MSNASTQEVSSPRVGVDPVDHRHQDPFRIDHMLVEFGPGGSVVPVFDEWSLGPLHMMLLEAADLLLTPDSNYTERFLYLVVLISGNVAIEANGEVHRVDAGNMLLVDLDAPHRQHFDRRAKTVLLRVPHKLLANRGFRNRRLGLVSLDMTAPDVAAVGAIIALLGQQKGYTSRELRRCQGEHLLDILSVVVDRSSACLIRRGSNVTLLRAKQFILQNIGNPKLSVGLVASAMDTSAAHLHRLFRADGCSLMRYVLRHRLQMAAEILARDPGRRMQVKEVAFRCGFSSHAYFSRVFRERFGIAPKDAAVARLNLERQSGDDPEI